MKAVKFWRERGDKKRPLRYIYGQNARFLRRYFYKNADGFIVSMTDGRIVDVAIRSEG